MTTKETPNKITAVLKVTATAEFFDDEASEETLRYCVEQDLEDAGFEVDVSLLKEHEAVEPKQVDLYGKEEWWGLVCVCPDCKAEWMSNKDDTHFCPNCGGKVKWNE